MKFELSYLETLIYENQTEHKPENLSKLEREKNRITKAWQRIAVQEPVLMVKKYFQQHQLAMIRLSHYVIADENPIATRAQHVAKELLHLLEFQYRDFMELDYVLPEQLGVEFLATFNSKREQAMGSLNDLQVHAGFANALTSAFNETTSVATLHRLTYRRKLQLEDLLDGLAIVITNAKNYPERLSRLLIQEFCRVNLNTMDGYLACKGYLQDEFNALPNLSEQIQKLKKQQVFLRHCKSIKQYYFTYNSRALSKGLLDWTTNQIHQLENKSHALNIEGEQSEDIIADSEKIMTSLSRPELALMVLLFFKSGVFINRYKAAVARFMANFVRTRKKTKEDYQSPGKLYSDMKNIKISTVDTVDRILDRMKRYNNQIRQEILKKKPKKPLR